MRPSLLPRIFLLSLALHCYLPAGTANRILEDQIAKVVLSIRAEAHLPKLTRIKHRDDLQAWPCMAAERDSSLHPSIFKTDEPLSSPQLREVALALSEPSGSGRSNRVSQSQCGRLAALEPDCRRNHSGLE